MALDLLWQKLEGFLPLLRCLPPSLWILNNSQLKFKRAMTSEDWTIFSKYNHRVRSLDMSSERLTRISTEIWAMISCPPFPFPLLPNLTSLTWRTAKETFSCIRLFVTQNLTTLVICTPQVYEDSFDPSIESILSSISILCPSVSHFCCYDLIDTSAALRSWSRLLYVRTEVVSDAAILHLANLPSLRELELALDVQSITMDTQAALQHSVFCALRELSVRCCNFASSDAFFRKLSISPQRLSFTIVVEMDFTEATVPASMSCISDACARNALEHLQVDIVEATYFAVPIGSQPFYTFRDLREFKFHADCKVELDDATLLQMAKSWPLLEELVIHAEYIEDLQYFTTNAFVVLLQHCPRLTSVEIDVNWSGIDQCDISPEIPYGGFVHENLLRANLGSSRIRHTAGVAAFLSAIAPNLERVCGWDRDYHPHCENHKKFAPRWKTVDRWVKSFSVIREWERRRMIKMINFGVIDGSNVRMGGKNRERGA